MIRTLVVDDDYHVAHAHAHSVRRPPGFSVAGEAHSAKEAPGGANVPRRAHQRVDSGRRVQEGRAPAVVAGQCLRRWHLGDRVEGAKMLREDPHHHQPASRPQRVGAVGVSIAQATAACVVTLSRSCCSQFLPQPGSVTGQRLTAFDILGANHLSVVAATVTQHAAQGDAKDRTGCHHDTNRRGAAQAG